MDKSEQDPIIGTKQSQEEIYHSWNAIPLLMRAIQRFVTPEWVGNTSSIQVRPRYKVWPKESTWRDDQDARSFLSQYEIFKHVSTDNNVVTGKRHQLLAEWIKIKPRELFKELREEQPIFEVPGYHDPQKGPQPSKFVVSKNADVREVLENQPDSLFRCALYQKNARGRWVYLGDAQ